MQLDAPALRRALAGVPKTSVDGLDTVHSLLCRREAGVFQRAAKETSAGADVLLVACTQEQRLFVELNEATEGAARVAERPIRFVNIRETAGWSRDRSDPTPKIAALLAAAQLPDPEPVATAHYRSDGRCLVVGSAEAAESAAALLDDRLDVAVLVTGLGGSVAQRRRRATHYGKLARLTGWLGAFEAEWVSDNPIDPDLCTRCNACVDACPEAAIGLDYQVNLDQCRSHRDCVRACDAAGAIDFDRAPIRRREAFDLILDLRPRPAFTMHQPPQGYFHVGSDSKRLQAAAIELRERVGEFEKPRFFRYQIRTCAHSRNEQVGCTACIDVCSTQAIRSDMGPKGEGGGVFVEPHLCAGCGGCSTVCPSGAISYGYPGAVDQGRRLRTTLAAYAAAGGADAALLLHGDSAGTRIIDELGRAARVAPKLQGIPARVIPLAVWHPASVGIDLWLAAIAYGATQVWVLLTPEDAPPYRHVLAEQMAVAQALLAGLGYRGEHLRLIEVRDARDLDALDSALRAPPAQTVAVRATFAAQADKRTTLDLAVEHLLAQAPAPVDEIALPAVGSPWGSIDVDTDKCTLCLSCVGACPTAALADNPDRPQLKFIENNCVQCRLCERTCPEKAITLRPRMWLGDSGKARKSPRVLAEMEPFRCVRCGKPFGTLRAVENMALRLVGHPAFQGSAAERLRMCADCRVIDIHTQTNEFRITD
jgi:ferredoxin